MGIKLTVVCENTVTRPGFIGEHGFSALLETDNGNILFDTGQGFSLIHNLLRFIKDVTKIEKVVLSHGHFDHTGGLLAFLGIRGPCQIIAHPDILKERFRLMSPAPGMEEKPVSIGIPWHEAYLTSRGARFQWILEWTEILPHVYVTGVVPRKTPFETGDPKFLVKTPDGFSPDPFLDDYSLIVDTPKGLVIILGCAHAGTVNILNYITDRLGKGRIYALVGGTHLDFSSSEQLEKTIEVLKNLDIEIIAVSHCTGQKAAVRMEKEFESRFQFAPVGFQLII
ncbi:MAG: MBL fold metallo-hydrolase [Syntrophobacterales bacterium]|nr:MBL fold metallo-hydrolase [Syntrophobacterales bacterium]